MINDWEPRLKRQINRLVNSGLYDSADELHLFVTDESNKLKSNLEEILKELPKIQLNYTNTNYGEGFLALSKVEELSRIGDYKILYFHTKGVFNKYKNFANKEIDNLKNKGVDCWVEMLEYFLIDNWKDCLDKLDDNDTAGVTNNGGWWWGNFWWTKSSHVLKNIPIKQFYGSRWNAEGWLHESNQEKDKIKFHEFYHFTYDPYYSILPDYIYKTNLEFTIEILDAKWGYFAEQRDEGRPLSNTELMFIDATESVKNNITKNKNNSHTIETHSSISVLTDPAEGFEKSLRVKFKTNIDPENEYIISSFGNWKIQIGRFQ